MSKAHNFFTFIEYKMIINDKLDLNHFKSTVILVDNALLENFWFLLAGNSAMLLL